MRKMIVSNWKQVYKSLAVWLPVIGVGLFGFLQNTLDHGMIPDYLNVPVVAILGVLGWVIKQPSMKKGG